MNKLFRIAAGVMAALTLVLPAMAEEAARPSITAHKMESVTIDGKLD